MQIIKKPFQKDWKKLLQRPTFNAKSLRKKVRLILNDIQKRGDEAIRQYTQQFDGVELEDIRVHPKEIEKAIKKVTPKLKAAIQQAAKNIKQFHTAQKEPIVEIETMKGVRCWRKSIGIEKVGLYIPGGTAPLFSTILMLGIPAKLAGCQEIILCTPPNKNGKIHPAILYTASLIGITKIYKIGGVQAIAGMAYGSDSIPKVYKIFGPGNQYVTTAKQLVQEDGVAIDMPAGPSEVMVVADKTANPAFVAADLLSQAEHGVDSQVVLVCFSLKIAKKVKQEVEHQLKQLPRKKMAKVALSNSRIFIVNKRKEALVLVNQYAPEHLIIATKQARQFANKVVNAGSIFIGNYSPESVGDYASGTNHTLPTNGFAKAYSGVSLDSFCKKITYQELTRKGLQNIANTVEQMAEAEELLAHKNAVSIRLSN